MEGTAVDCYGGEQRILSAAERVENALTTVSADRISVGGLSTILTAEAASKTHPELERAKNQDDQPEGTLSGFQAVL